MSRRLQIALLGGLLLIAMLVAVRAVGRWREFRRAEGVCSAAEREDWEAALAGRPVPPATVAGLREADCRCLALLAQGRGEECLALVERLLGDPDAGDWLPRPTVVAALVAGRRARGDLAGALELARRGADAYPQHLALLLDEARLLLQLDTHSAALEAVTARLPRAGESATALRLLAATLANENGQSERALALLGDRPEAPQQRDAWYRLRMMILARLGRAPALAAIAEEWGRVEGRAATSLALYAYLLSVTQQMDPQGRPVLDLLCTAATAGDAVGDPLLLQATYVRCVSMLSVLGMEEEALRFFDEGTERFGGLGHLDREDLVRTARTGATDDALDSTAGRLELRVDRSEPGDVLLVSPDAADPRDAAFVAEPVPPSGRVTIERSHDTWPVRWVLRDDAGRVRGSGAAWPDPLGTVVVPVQRRAPAAAVAARPLARRPAAGRPRLFVVILDCGDWRFVQHGIARGELPVLDALAGSGRTAILSSVPPLTAIAIRTIAEPGARGVDGVLSLVHQLGAEVAGLSFVTANPAAPLGWVLPQGGDLFGRLGFGKFRVVNLLHSYGAMQLGKHGQVTGPQGLIGQARLAPERALRPDEAAHFTPAERRERELVDIALDFDDAATLARGGDVDLMVLRVAALDLITHGTFPETAEAGQDDGGRLLYRTYRYIDRRLGELYSALDGNDVLVVMSDHGARTALEHDPRALFIAAGGGLTPGRLPGEPSLRGVPRMIADFFGVETDWPDTGVHLRPAAATPSP